MHNLTRRTYFVIAGILALSVSESANARLVATYRFGNTLAADQIGAPPLTRINSGAFVKDSGVFGESRTVYQRGGSPAAPSALRLDTRSLSLTPNNYAVQLVFAFTSSANSWRRIINSYDPSSLSDSGFYVGTENTLDIYQGGSHKGGHPWRMEPITTWF